MTNATRQEFTRAHFLAIGLHIDLTTLAEMAGCKMHVFIRRDAFERVTENQSRFRIGENDLGDAIFRMCRAIVNAPPCGCPIPFHVGNVALIAHLGKLDEDDERPAATVFLASPAKD